jgi:hypothetical protein
MSAGVHQPVEPGGLTDERTRYAHWFRCRACGSRFSVLRLTPDPERVKTPACPRKRCGGRVKQSHVPDIGMDVAAGIAPAVVGANVQVRAYDTALEIVAQDHAMTDIKDRVRPGETSVPSLAPHLQKMADNFWGGQRKQPAVRRGKVDLSPVFGQRAIDAQGGVPAGAQFSLDRGSAIAPILQQPGKAPGDSPIPKHQIIAG